MVDTQIVFGAPGCGKTTHLLGILEKELESGTEPERIAFVSFTRKGAYEGRDRAKEQFGFTNSELPYFRTLHSIAFWRGGFSKYDMISRKDYRAFSDHMEMHFTGYYTEEFFHNDDVYLFLNFLTRNNTAMAQAHFANADINVAKYRHVKHNYERYKTHAKVVDFTDIMTKYISDNEPLDVDVAIIDEAQDLTTLQWQMCNLAFRNCKRIYIAGDDDQAIYEWNGADVGKFLGVEGKRLVLDKSYRLQKKILEFAQTISAQIETRVPKDFHSMSDEGDVHFYNSLDEIEINPDESYYFLSRNNYFLRWFREFLQSKGQVYLNKGKPSAFKEDIAAINLFEKVRRTKIMTDEETVKLRPYIEDKMNLRLPWYDNFDLLPNDTVMYLRDLIREKTSLDNIRQIQINTIHGVKGGEADNVVLLLDTTKAVIASYQRSPDAELRCLYVACTRAKKHLHIIHSNSANGYDNFLDVMKGR